MLLSIGSTVFKTALAFLTLSVYVAASEAPIAQARGTTWMNLDTGTGQRDSQIQEDTASPSASSTSASVTTSGSTVLTNSVTQATAVPTSQAPLQLPRPFDLILGNNFTQQSCPNFFNDNIINNSTLQSCIPFSLLLQNSNAFIRATKYASTLTPIIDASCNVSFSSCNSLMSGLAARLISSDACGSDMALGNPLVVRAYDGLISYAPMFHASCLKADPHGKSDQGSFDYCYVNAMNSSSSADSAMYYLPLGLELTTGSSVSCSKCTQDNMAIFANAAADTESPLNKDYLDAANMVNNACGADFVDASPSVTKSGSSKNSGSTVRQPALGFLIAFASVAAIVMAS